jgi:hypothetical protein
MTLVKYRDAGMNSYTYFYKNKDNHTISPFFDSEREAEEWLELEKYKLQARGIWNDSCTTPRGNE